VNSQPTDAGRGRHSPTWRLVPWLLSLVFVLAVGYSVISAVEPRAPGMPITGGTASPGPGEQPMESMEGMDHP
jgi:hypothetical protein